MKTLVSVLIVLVLLVGAVPAAEKCPQATEKCPQAVDKCPRELCTTHAELYEVVDGTIQMLTGIRAQLDQDADSQVRYVECGHQAMMQQLHILTMVLRRCYIAKEDK